MHNGTRIIYLYKITNMTNQKIYIGQTVEPKNRWYQHRRDAACPKYPLHFSIRKHGAHNFSFEIIDFAFNPWQAECLERNLIVKYDSLIQNGKGYNISLGGMHAPKTEEWKAQMSAIKGGWIGREQELSDRMTGNSYAVGNHCSDEHKQAISLAHTNKIVSDETKKKLSERQIGEKNHMYGKATWNSGKTGMYSEETLQKMSNAKKGKITWNKGKPSPRIGKTWKLIDGKRVWSDK